VRFCTPCHSNQRIGYKIKRAVNYMDTKNNEGTVYLCRWRKADDSFEIEAAGNPKWRTIGNSFEDAESQLIFLLQETNGDFQPCFEYIPEPPKNVIRLRFEGLGIVGVSGANDFEDFVGEAEELFERGICEICKIGIGNRTERHLLINQYPKGDGGYVRIRLGGFYGDMKFQIFSLEFVNALSLVERDRFSWIPVDSDRGSKRKFFEPISAPVAERIMPKGLFPEKERLQSDGFFCAKCRRTQLVGIPQGAAGLFSFISEADLPTPLPSCFQIGQTANLEFCMSKKRWEELKGKLGTNRLTSRQIGIAKKNWVNLHPKLQVLERHV